MFYDEVIPDAFRNPFQKMPLDHDTDDFYANRGEAVDARLEQIEAADDAELRDMIRDRCGSSAQKSRWSKVNAIAFDQIVSSMKTTNSCFERLPMDPS